MGGSNNNSAPLFTVQMQSMKEKALEDAASWRNAAGEIVNMMQGVRTENDEGLWLYCKSNACYQKNSIIGDTVAKIGIILSEWCAKNIFIDTGNKE